MFLLTKEQLNSHQDAKVCYICRKRILKKLSKSMNYRIVGDHFQYTGKYRGAAHSICNLKFNVHNEIYVVFHSGSNYDYHFIIKELANEFDGQFECLVENKEKYKAIDKEATNIDEDGDESVLAISYNIIVQDLMQGHYQILFIIKRKEFIKLNVKNVIFFLNLKGSTTIL